ncbi:MAG: M23 family metallopeptidase [candidate division Zixibacteria bacterium]|nr:M23 family metallopeptidase [candidate division Zixibacteria bacterium]NIR63242.1 M23 family metallopeptidase [candidate division Zixibacteria bacterium]NIS17102.1 M23 family metallopeptidase [candidate division Zixibacteria bacterium]NIS45223.1 M23 family metallopeptidase [candidate division Zixibacteria bacterium]NIT53454.1 M23 family metallopeptidase [candidate division Zixibacteria bacterium]
MALLLIFSVPLQAEYLWPLPASKELTSHFCAFRGGHYHAGIDIRTFGKTGYNVVAVEDGYLWRVASNWWGYGNVVYLKLDDGNIAVYGHLLEFTPEVEKYVRDNQLHEGRFKVNLFPEKDRFRFRKGDLVGKTGQSGSGPPHLHFEIRNADNQPMNPLPFYPDLRDGYKPRYEEITFRPLDSDSYIEGRARPYSIDFQYNRADNNYILNKVPSLRGEIGIEVKVADRRSGTDRKYNVAGLKFYLNDELVFETEYDTLSFNTWGSVDLDYNHYQRIKNKSYYHNLYYPEGRKSSQQNPDDSCRTCKAVPIDHYTKLGIYNARIIAYDRNGNEREARFQINIIPNIDLNAYVDGLGKVRGNIEGPIAFTIQNNAPFYANLEIFDPATGTFSDAGQLMAGSGMEEIPHIKLSEFKERAHSISAEYALLKINFISENQKIGSYLIGLPNTVRKRFLDSTLVAEVDFIEDLDFISSEPLISIDPKKLYDFLIQNDFRANFLQPIESGDRVTFRPQLIEPLKEFAYGEDFQNLPAILALERLKQQNHYLHEWHKVSEIDKHGFELSIPKGTPGSNIFFKLETSGSSPATEIKIKPDDRIIFEGMEIKAPVPSGYSLEKTALYGISRGGDPSFAGNNLDSAGYILANVKSFGTYRIMVDSVPPKINSIRPWDNSNVNTARPSIRFFMDDELSGFDSDTLLTVTLDGDFQICEYDIDRKIVYIHLTEDLAPGRHDLVITARDRLGNTTVKSSSFTY